MAINKLIDDIVIFIEPLNQILYEILMIIILYHYFQYIKYIYLDKKNMIIDDKNNEYILFNKTIIVIFCCIIIILDIIIWKNYLQSFIFLLIITAFVYLNIIEIQKIIILLKTTIIQFNENNKKNNKINNLNNNVNIPKQMDLPLQKDKFIISKLPKILNNFDNNYSNVALNVLYSSSN